MPLVQSKQIVRNKFAARTHFPRVQVNWRVCQLEHVPNNSCFESQTCYDTQAGADTTINMFVCGTTLCTSQLSPEICCRLAKNAKWRQNVSTREGPVLSGPGPATATRHSTKNIWNWSVKNLVNYVDAVTDFSIKNWTKQRTLRDHNLEAF